MVLQTNAEAEHLQISVAAQKPATSRPVDSSVYGKGLQIASSDVSSLDIGLSASLATNQLLFTILP